MAQRYHKVKDGEPVTLVGGRGLFAQRVMCCDCALVHVFEYRSISSSRMVVVGWRDERSTKIQRKRRRA